MNSCILGFVIWVESCCRFKWNPANIDSYAGTLSLLSLALSWTTCFIVRQVKQDDIRFSFVSPYFAGFPNLHIAPICPNMQVNHNHSGTTDSQMAHRAFISLVYTSATAQLHIHIQSFLWNSACIHPCRVHDNSKCHIWYRTELPDRVGSCQFTVL